MNWSPFFTSHLLSLPNMGCWYWGCNSICCIQIAGMHSNLILFQKQIVPKTNCSESFGSELAFHAPPHSTKGTVSSCAVYCVIKSGKWAAKRCCLVNGYHHLLFLFRNSGIATSSPLNGEKDHNTCQKWLLFSMLFSANSSLRFCGFCCFGFFFLVSK